MPHKKWTQNNYFERAHLIILICLNELDPTQPTSRNLNDYHVNSLMDCHIKGLANDLGMTNKWQTLACKMESLS